MENNTNSTSTKATETTENTATSTEESTSPQENSQEKIIEKTVTEVLVDNKKEVDTSVETIVSVTTETKNQNDVAKSTFTLYKALKNGWFIKEANSAIENTINTNNLAEKEIDHLLDPDRVTYITKKFGILGIDSFMLGSIWLGLGRLIITVFAVILALTPLLGGKLTSIVTGFNVDAENSSFTAILVLSGVLAAVSITLWIISIFSAKSRTKHLNTIRFAEQIRWHGKVLYGFSIHDVIEIGFMAALVFVSTQYLKIEIPTPTGATMLKLGNTVCLITAILLGGIKGGLAAGIGSALFDLTNPQFIASAPVTFINFFIMAYICGGVIRLNSKQLELTDKSISISYKSPSFSRIITACVLGAFSYVLLYSTKNIVNLVLLGSSLPAAIAGSSTKIIVSISNATVAATIVSLTGGKILAIWNKLHQKQRAKR